METYEVNGVIYKLVPAVGGDGNRCKGCAFKASSPDELNNSCMESPECWDAEGNDLIFVEE